MTNGHTFNDNNSVRGRFYGVVPVFLVDDVGAAAEYYRDVLGFEVEFLYGDDPTYGRVTRDDAIIDLARAEPAGTRNSVKAGGSAFGVDAVIVVSDVEDVYIEIQEKGAIVVERLAAREYGALDCTIEDINGYRLTISGDLDEATMPDETPDLAARRCEACHPGTPTLPPEQVARLLPQVPDWSLSEDGTALRWTKRFRDFAEALTFVNRVAEIAEAEDHHPDIRIHGYRNVDLDLSTHAIGGLSQNDFIMAAKIDQLRSTNA